ncbi:hypothetical protein [Lamprocystis purpurea]|uniref:hypothetical protein n=1 Tax=Lamprocystis purpurea TaxID=61598 RepID=UPI0003646B87|nr:hypothetical protein [Lamprocystis purpurea]
MTDLISQIEYPRLRKRLNQEWATATKEKKFGLVFDPDLPDRFGWSVHRRRSPASSSCACSAFRTAWGKPLLCLVLLLSVVAPLPVRGQSPLMPPAGTCRPTLYQGTLGPDADLRLSLVRQGDVLTGSWYRESEGVYDTDANRFRHRRLELSGPLAADGGFVLTQTDPEQSAEPRVRGRVTGAFGARGALTGTWEGGAGEPALAFHLEPIDSLEQGRQPRFRLRFAAIADDGDAERVWLSIGGGPELLLTGVRNDAAFPCHGGLDLESVVVRQLSGTPDLYWITYDITGETGSSRSTERRHRIVPVDRVEAPLFDAWLNSYSGGNQGFDATQDEQADITYKDATLRIETTSARGEDSDGQDCEMCGYAHDHCASYCRDFICEIATIGATMKGDRESCETACLGNCQAADFPARCAAEKATLVQFSGKRLRLIAAATGRVLSDEHTWDKTFFPSWFRCAAEGAAAPLTFSIRDDGRVGRLQVRSVPGPDPATDRAGSDQPPPSATALADCWLYSRVPGDGPPPDQLRVGHFVPDDCCVVETPAGGQRTLIYERVKDAHGDATQGRPLVLFDTPSRLCYNANLAADGPWGRAWVEAVVAPERMTLGLGVIREAPDPAAAALLYRSRLDADWQRIGSGTLVLTLGRQAFSSRVAGVEDHWYYVAAPHGVFGWAFGSDLTPFDSSHPQRAYRVVLERQRVAARDPAQQADGQAFIGRVRAETPKRFSERGGAAADPRRVLERFAAFVETCRTPRAVQDGARDAPRVESVARHTRITVVPGVRLRPDPEPGCGQLERLALGTVVTVRKRTVVPSRVDGVAGRWYQVESPAGISGWVFGGLLAPHDPTHPLLSYGEILERHLASEPKSLRAELEFLELLARVRPTLAEDLAADVELARLQGLGRVLALGFSCNDLPPAFALSLADAPSVAALFRGLETDVKPVWEEGPERLDPAAYWALHERFRGRPAAERLAWAAAQASGNDPVTVKIAVDCLEWNEEDEGGGGMQDALASLVDDGFVRYLADYPAGAHAEAAVESLARALAAGIEAADLDPGAVCDPDVQAGLRAALRVLAPLAGEQAAAARAQISQLVDRPPCSAPVPD